MSLDATPIHQPAQAGTAWRSDALRVMATAALGLLILCLPLARHWVRLHRPPFEIYYEFTSIVLYLSDVAVILVLATSLVWLWREKPSVNWGPAAITIPLTLLPILAFVTAPWAGDPALAVYVGIRLAALLGIYIAIVALRPSIRVVQLSLAASLALQAAVAVAQFVTQDDLGWHWLGEIELNPTSGFASIIEVGSRLWLRGYGLTPHPNILGGVLTVILLALIVPYLESRGRRRAMWLAVLVLGGAGLIVSFSRAAWLGGAAGGSVLLLGVLADPRWRRQYGRAILVPALVGVIALTGFALVRPDLILARLKPSASQTESRSLDERRVLAEMSLDLIRRSPLTGVGAGNFSAAVAPLVRGIPRTTPQPVHNLPLLLAAELGLAGGALWVWLMLAPVFVTVVGARQAGLAIRLQGYLLSGLPRPYTNAERPDGKLSLWVLGLTAGLVALAIIDLFDFYSWGWPQGRLLRWVLLGLWASALNGSAG